MKIEKKETDFIPVIITLETQKEVEELRSQLGNNEAGGKGISFELWDELDELRKLE